MSFVDDMNAAQKVMREAGAEIARLRILNADLLAALELLANGLESSAKLGLLRSARGEPFDPEPAIKVARAAISKAKGEDTP